MQKPSYPLAVVMQLRLVHNRWVQAIWEPWSVLPGGREGDSGARLLVEEHGFTQWLHPGFTLLLHRDEAEGYYLNVSAQDPRVFVLWHEEEGRGVPLAVTASANEAARWADGGHSVDGVTMPPEIYAWVGRYVEQNYRPEPEKRIKPRSFRSPRDRA
ncbi:MAG TPA: DUF3305 domain-containing protein [Burkholderiales bacterium]|nr:DUF3305 domain-containing protein [Burkholderiales bacterium]